LGKGLGSNKKKEFVPKLGKNKLTKGGEGDGGPRKSWGLGGSGIWTSLDVRAAGNYYKRGGLPRSKQTSECGNKKNNLAAKQKP